MSRRARREGALRASDGHCRPVHASGADSVAPVPRWKRLTALFAFLATLFYRRTARVLSNGVTGKRNAYTMNSVKYICASSSRQIDGRLEGNTVWFEFREVAYLFGMNLERANKILRQADATGDIKAANDVRSSDRCKCLLSHRAVVAFGYRVNYGRATAFRHWCAAALTAQFR